MSGKVLYRKYRPTKLADVVGQPQVTDALQNALKQSKLGHAYLFIGPRGTGKTSVARIFAHAVNDFDYQVEDSYLDIIEIDAASNTGVDNIRELREKAVIAPTNGKYKVYIIDEVHMLTKSASNALLKTLEEPPEHVIFIMATTDAHKVPLTISSRTQVFTFKLADPETMLAHLQAIAQQEGIKITPDALKLVVKRGGGSFRDSLSLLDQVATLADGEITTQLLETALGLPQDLSIQKLLSAYASQDSASIQTLLKDLLNTGIKPELIASELIAAIIARPEPVYLGLLAKLSEVQPPFPEAKLLLALLSSTLSSTAPAVVTAAPKRTAHTPVTATAKPTPRATATTRASAEPRVPAPSVAEPSMPTAETTSSTTIEAAPDATTEPAPIAVDGKFDWEAFLEAIRKEHLTVYQQLQKTDYEFSSDTLHLYPSQKFAKNVLERPANSKILAKHLGGVALVIHDIGDRQAPKDETISQISAIMGDVREIKGDMPF